MEVRRSRPTNAPFSPHGCGALALRMRHSRPTDATSFRGADHYLGASFRGSDHYLGASFRGADHYLGASFRGADTHPADRGRSPRYMKTGLPHTF